MKAFRQTIQELSTNDKLDKLGHNIPLSKKRVKQLTSTFPAFEDIDLEQWQGYPPPSNSSQVVRNEINYLISLAQFRDLLPWKIDIAIHDTNAIQSFKDYLNKHKLEVDLDRIDSLRKQTDPILLSLKRYYNRPRPKILAKKLGIDLSFFPLKTAETPSYPSGHATQGRLMAKLIADEVPLQYRRDILAIGERIGHSRQIAGAHYQSDTEFGHRLGDELYRLATTSREPDLTLESLIKEEEVKMTVDMFLPDDATYRTVIYEAAAIWGLVKTNALNDPEWANTKVSSQIGTMKQWYNDSLEKGMPSDVWENFCLIVGGHMTEMGLTSKSKFIWNSIDKYYKAAPKSWQVSTAGKKNTADCVMIKKGSAKTLLKKCADLSKVDEAEQVKRTVTDSSNLVKVDKDIEFYQVSLKLDGAPGAAREGKWTKLAAKGIETKVGDLIVPSGLANDPRQVVKNHYDPTFVYDPNEFLVEGLFGDIKDKIKAKVSGFLKKIKSIFKKIVKKIVSSAKKLTDTIIKRDKKIIAAQGIAKEMSKMGMPLKEELLNEFSFTAARKGKPIELTKTLHKHIQDFKKEAGGIEKSFKLIDKNVKSLNTSKKRKANPIVYKKGSEATQLITELNQLKPLYKLSIGVKLDSVMYSMFWTLLNLNANWVSYIYVNNVLRQIKEKMDSYDNLEYGLSDAVLSMSGDVSAEAKFGNTALPLVIIKGHGVIARLGDRDNYSDTIAKDLKKTEVYTSDFPVLEIDIHRVGKQGALHNTVNVFLLTDVEIDKTGETVIPIYSSTSFSSKSGSKFSTAAEVNRPRKGWKH